MFLTSSHQHISTSLQLLSINIVQFIKTQQLLWFGYWTYSYCDFGNISSYYAAVQQISTVSVLVNETENMRWLWQTLFISLINWLIKETVAESINRDTNHKLHQSLKQRDRDLLANMIYVFSQLIITNMFLSLRFVIKYLVRLWLCEEVMNTYVLTF